MKTKLNLFNLRPVLCAVTILGLALSSTLQAAPPAADEVIRSRSATLPNAYVYSIKFGGGTVYEFFRFMRTNGFGNDTILFAGEAGNIDLPSFTVSNVQLKEVAKSLEFVAEDKVSVELIEMPQAGDVNIWRIKLAKSNEVSPIKTKACALPYLLSGDKALDRVHRIEEQVERTLMEGALNLNRDMVGLPRGRLNIIESEKIVVIVGTEAYVEAIASALDAAETVVAPPRQR